MRTALYTRRQKKVWVMFAYNEMNHEADEIKVFRTEAKDKEAMEADIAQVCAAAFGTVWMPSLIFNFK